MSLIVVLLIWNFTVNNIDVALWVDWCNNIFSIECFSFVLLEHWWEDLEGNFLENDHEVYWKNMEVEDDVVGQEHVLEDREQVIALIIFFWLKVEHVKPVENNEQVDHHVDDRHSHREVSDDSHLVQVEWNLEKEWP
jgi:hypothetical protein